MTQNGAYNLRQNGVSICHGDSEHIRIRKKEDKPGIDILIDGDTKGERVFIPVIVVSVSGMTDLVYNDFYIADGADVTIVAGCGIHNSGCNESRHDGIHTFHVGKNANVRYEEKHYGEGSGTGSRILNPVTNIEVGENSVFTLTPFRSKAWIPRCADTECFRGGRLQALCDGAHHDRRNTACGVQIWRSA
ncbi:MAG: SufD family Fe-S cluster assembly protein [Clostridium sp.]